MSHRGSTSLTMTAAEATSRLTAEGSRFELNEIGVDGVTYRCWKNLPASIASLITAFEGFGDRTALVYEDEEVTYAALLRAIRRLSAEMAGFLPKGGTVAIVAPNTPEWVAAYFAVLALGGVAVLLNPAAPPDELKRCIALVGARIAVVDGDRTPRAVEAVTSCPETELVLVSRAQVADTGRIRRLESVIGPPAAWNDLPDVAGPSQGPQAGDTASIFFTSGTTGAPRGVAVSHRALACNIFHSGFRLARACLMSGQPLPGPDDPPPVCLDTLPLFHVSGSASTILSIMARGGALVFMRWWSAKRALELIERRRVTIVSAVAPAVVQMLDHPDRPTRDLGSLSQVIHGGAPSPPGLAGRIASELMASPGQSWGMTETCGGLTGLLGAEQLLRPDSCGPAAPITDLAIRDPAGRSLGVGEVGELWVRSPQVMLGYWNDPEATSEAIKDGWLRTGDVAQIDEEGYCRVVDRVKDMLICGGENVYCSEVENVLCDHPAVLEAAVVAIPNESFGEVPAAVVVLAGEGQTDGKALRAFTMSRLAAYKAPLQFHLTREPLPRNAAGKVLKTVLKGHFLKSLPDSTLTNIGPQ